MDSEPLHPPRLHRALTLVNRRDVLVPGRLGLLGVEALRVAGSTGFWGSAG